MSTSSSTQSPIYSSSTPAAPPSVPASDGIFSFSSGLVQITGLSTLVGGSGLEELSLGLKAAPGLAWSAVSCLGMLKVVRACVAAGVVPDHTWRDVLGLRTSTVDDALGFGFWTDVTKPVAGGTTKSSLQAAMRASGGRLVDGRNGIWLDVGGEMEGSGMLRDEVDTDGARDRLFEEKLTGWYSTVAQNRSLKGTVAMTSAFGQAKGIYIHRFIPDDTAHDYRVVDWAILMASLLKATEAFTLYRMGSVILWWSNFVGWAVCFVAALLLHASNSGRDTHNNIRSTADFLLGELPSYKHIGGSDKRIILGQPVSVRQGLCWRLAWIAGAVANMVGLGITFYVLAEKIEQSATIVYVWLAFQILWLVLRTLAYHVIPDASGALNINLSSQLLECASADLRIRVLRLLLAASLLQTHEHFRVYEGYEEDIQSMSSPQQLIRVLQQAQWRSTDSLPEEITLEIGKARVEAVLGEELLRTIVWITGVNIDNAEIYDAVALLIRAGDGQQFLVPAVRVMAGKPIRPLAVPDPENSSPSFDLRGTMNREKTGYWVYWIPAKFLEGQGWLEIRCDSFSVLGPFRGHRLLTDAALDKELGAGSLSISLRGTADLERALDASRIATQLLLETVKSLAG